MLAIARKFHLHKIHELTSKLNSSMAKGKELQIYIYVCKVFPRATAAKIMQIPPFGKLQLEAIIAPNSIAHLEFNSPLLPTRTHL